MGHPGWIVLKKNIPYSNCYYTTLPFCTLIQKRRVPCGPRSKRRDRIMPKTASKLPKKLSRIAQSELEVKVALALALSCVNEIAQIFHLLDR